MAVQISNQSNNFTIRRSKDSSWNVCETKIIQWTVHASFLPLYLYELACTNLSLQGLVSY